MRGGAWSYAEAAGSIPHGLPFAGLFVKNMRKMLAVKKFQGLVS